MSGAAPRRGPVSAEVAHVIELMLQSTDPEQVKAGLQRACEVFENGQAFTNPEFLRMGLAAHLRSPVTKVRRWAYKLVALLRDPEHIYLLEDALLRIEQDPENRGWAAAAYAGIADERRQEQLIDQIDDYWGTSLELAAKLYARGQPARAELNLQVWEKEPLARKWLCLLCGYAPGSPRTIDQRFGNLDLVRNSIVDSDREIIEYSIWAEHHHPDGSYRGLLRQPDQLLAHPNVRRWLYRLLTKDSDAAVAHQDLLLEGMLEARETSDVAREGLALGFAKIYSNEFEIKTIEWFANETSYRVKLALVDNLALMANRYDSAVAREVLVAEYSRQGPSSVLGAKILSVSRSDWRLSSLQLSGNIPISLPGTGDLFSSSSNGQQIIVNIHKEKIMGNKIEQSGSNNSMAGVVAGDMYESTISALQHQTDQRFNELTPLIASFLKNINTSQIDETEKKTAFEAATAVAEAGGEEKKGKLATLKGVVRGLLALPGMATDAIEDGQKLVEAIQSMIP